ncbi:LytR family transcriptional attenuator [Actinomadura hallensis]|uniref:LytR family transcriptional attenuator n=1 Tax=Actinomadura hallensis TaxID=337895 RepID=A0A543ICY8_9ACTN|nr:LCP family protein [Actinomadura hallensis]TQM68411.1 LytR family transcriptional attenuator [Actinomadura hallensis]HLV72873.1 LCP family protein [Vulgatibacteraceae bacterium]
MTDGWPEGWTRKEDDRVARSRERYVRAEHHQPAAYGRERHGDPYDDPYAGDQLRGAGRYDHGDPYGDPYGGPPPRRRRRRRGGRVFGAVLVVLLLVLVGGYFYLDSRLNREAVLVDYPGRVADTPGTNWLIVGSDSREGLSREDQKRLRTGRAAGRRTDSMMLLHYGSGGTSLISLPRDSYVAIPGKGRNKLNAAFAFGGPKLLVQTVEEATGVRIDHYAEIGFGGFVGIVDALGGVDMCIKEDIKDPKAGLDLKAGCQTLDGGQALGYVRTRAYARADLQRVENQRQFFGALMEKAASPGTMFNPFKSIPLAMNATSNFTVDEGDHLHHLVRMMWAMRGVSGDGGVTTTVPIGGGGSAPGVGSYITWDRAKASRLFDAIKQDQPIPPDVIEKK